MSADRSALRRVPGIPRVRVVSGAGRRARITSSLTAASDWRRRAADSLAMLPVAAIGTGWLPDGGRSTWPGHGPAELEAMLRAALPSVRLLGMVLPWDPDRRRLLLLCWAAGNPLVVKLGDDEDVLRAEHCALSLLAADPLPGIATPRPFGIEVVGTGHDGGPVVALATSALGLRAQRPAIDEPLRTFESDLASRLADLPGRPPATAGVPRPVPVHGDLAPWNLRRTSRGLALFDWEAVGWGPPGADLAHYRDTCDEVRPWWRRPPARGAGSAP